MPSSPTQDATVATQICDELDLHANAEEQVVYPVIKAEVPGGASMVDGAVDEHKEARQLIGRVRLTKDPGHLAGLMTELEQAISHQVEEESRRCFRRPVQRWIRGAWRSRCRVRSGEELTRRRPRRLPPRARLDLQAAIAATGSQLSADATIRRCASPLQCRGSRRMDVRVATQDAAVMTPSTADTPRWIPFRSRPWWPRQSA